MEALFCSGNFLAQQVLLALAMCVLLCPTQDLFLFYLLIFTIPTQEYKSYTRLIPEEWTATRAYGSGMCDLDLNLSEPHSHNIQT